MRALKRWIAAVAVVALVIGTGVSMQCVTVSALSEEIQAQQTTEEQTSDQDAEKNQNTEKKTEENSQPQEEPQGEPQGQDQENNPEQQTGNALEATEGEASESDSDPVQLEKEEWMTGSFAVKLNGPSELVYDGKEHKLPVLVWCVLEWDSDQRLLYDGEYTIEYIGDVINPGEVIVKIDHFGLKADASYVILPSAKGVTDPVEEENPIAVVDNENPVAAEKVANNDSKDNKTVTAEAGKTATVTLLNNTDNEQVPLSGMSVQKFLRATDIMLPAAALIALIAAAISLGAMSKEVSGLRANLDEEMRRHGRI